MISFLLLAASAAAQVRPTIVMYGPEGGVSCSNAWKPEFRQGTESYVRGLWSGMNLATSSRVGHALGQTGAIEDVKKRCVREPDGLVGTVAERSYYTARRQGR